MESVHRELVSLAKRQLNSIVKAEECDQELSEQKRRCVVVEDGNVVDLNGKTVQWTSDLKNCRL